MKDYYDCFMMIEENVLDVDMLKKATLDTFHTRGTEVEIIPDIFIETLKSRWNGFKNKEKLENMNFRLVVSKINDFLIKLDIF